MKEPCKFECFYDRLVTLKKQTFIDREEFGQNFDKPDINSENLTSL